MKTRRGPYSLPERGAALDVTRSGYQTWAHRDLRGGPPRAGRLLRPAGLSQKRRRQFQPERQRSHRGAKSSSPALALPSAPSPSKSIRMSRGSAPLLGPTMPRFSSSSMIRAARP